MIVDKIVLKGGTVEVCIYSWRERIIASLSILLLGKMWGGMGISTITNADVKLPGDNQ